MDIRNIAIIAHVDHGKTSLVNALLKQGGIFRDNQEVLDRVMDSNALERERGITILSKNCSAYYKGTKINIVDTPGHADFGGEVERVLKMVDGVLLVVDAFEGPMPQTRFVLEKALALNLKVVIVINKIDRPDARLDVVGDEVLELMLDLNASDEQLDSPIIYCSAREGVATTDYKKPGVNMEPLFEAIINHIDPPKMDEDAPFQMLISSTEQNDYLGKLAVGKVESGTIKLNQTVYIKNFFDSSKAYSGKVVNIFNFNGLKRDPIEQGTAGDIICIAGLPDITIGDTISETNEMEPIPFVKISEPSVEMTFMVNDSPFAGKEGKYVTSRHIKERLYKEAVKDLSLQVEDGATADQFKVRGRGEMHLSILIENMRRDGYEFQVSRPRVLYKTIDGVRCEPIDKVVLDVPEDCVGTIMQSMGVKKGELLDMSPIGSRMRLQFLVPSRGLFGYKSQMLTDTRGEGVMSSVFYDYEPYKGDIEGRNFGSLISYETGEAVTYGLFNAQGRGRLLVKPGDKVYMGQVVGANPKGDDIVVNVCKKKQLTNTRSSASDEALKLIPVQPMSLEAALEFIADDELVEVTPKSIRIRKQILDHQLRAKSKKPVVEG
ncbi:MAG TPA: translational GTPase TypA [Candidatus Onthoplasma faecigallinarum]|nr:translational GTPase TypA [Candidatus Onthoplasma faecigallinarum]